MTYVRNAWYVASWGHDIAPGHVLGVHILNEPIVIWRNASGELVAFEDRCIHRLAPLSLGRCEEGRLRCMYHGFLYDRSGCVVEIPGQARVSARLRLRSYPVVERHSWIWVWMADGASADDSLIPPVIGLDNPDYVLAHGQLDYAAEGRLVIENLLDLSHLSFLHKDSFQVSDAWARESPKFSKHERSVRTERWNRSEPVWLNPGELTDEYFLADFYVPGILIVRDRFYPVGTADEWNGSEPRLEQPENAVNMHAVTPMTDRTTRYFFSVGSHRRGNGAELDADLAVTRKGFAEDKLMIEAQQRVIDATPDARFLSTRNDRGVILFNQILERLAQAESGRLGGCSRPVSPA